MLHADMTNSGFASALVTRVSSLSDSPQYSEKELFRTQVCAVYEVQGLGPRIGPQLLCHSVVELEGL